MAEIPKPFSQTEIQIGWPRTLLGTAVVFVLLSLAGYFALAGYESVAKRQVKDLEKEIQDIAASLPATEIEKLLVLDSQIKSLKKLLPNHTYFSRILEFLEVNLHPQVRLDLLEADSDTRKVSLQGVGPNAEVLSLQAAAFERARSTEALIIKGINPTTGGLNFSFEILFQPALILPQ